MNDMETAETLRADSLRVRSRVLIERLIDALVLSAVLVLPAGALFALWQVLLGDAMLASIGVVVAACGALGIYARLVVPFQLKVKHITLAPSAISPSTLGTNLQSPISPLRIVFFSDLHVGRVKQTAWTRKVVNLVNAQKPDVVLIGGDFVGHLESSAIPAMLEPLRDLRARLGVFAVLGNHDYGLPGEDHSVLLQKLLTQYNVRLLSNERVMVGDRLQLVGIDELWDGHSDVPRAFAGADPAASRTIVLGHNPDLMMQITQRADLFIFGHTHGAQVYIPYLARFIVPIRGSLYRGEHHLPQGMVYVSSGCGETTTPTRLFTQVEIVAMDI
jgi:uncharacterized protein